MRDLCAPPVGVAEARQFGREMEPLVDALTRRLAGDEVDVVDVGALDPLELIRMLRTEVVRSVDDDSGEIIEVMRAFEDIEQVLRVNRSRVAMSSALTPFARRMLREVAHMLRSPLSSIVMLGEMLLEEQAGALTDEQRRQVEIIYRAALGVTSASNDILNLVSDRDRIDTVERLSLDRLIRTVADVIGPVAEARGRTVRTRIEGDVERTGARLALLEVLLSLGLRAALLGRGGFVELAADGTARERVWFSVTTRPGAMPDDSGGATGDLPHVFRIEDDAASFTLSPEGLALASAEGVLEALGSELTIDAGPGNERAIRFGLDLPHA